MSLCNPPAPIHAVMLLSVIVCACGIESYQRRAELPPSEVARLEEAESFYVGEAKQKAAFVTGCTAEVASTPLVRRKSGQTLVLHRGVGGTLYYGEVTTVIGVDACGTRLVYNVVCGPDRQYDAPLGEFENYTPCDVVQDGSAAEAALHKAAEAEAEERKRSAEQQQSTR